tara:strand:- start:33027 stop:33398 length:372 start_codon:yes stop_codon:yes gene_type:complete
VLGTRQAIRGSIVGLRFGVCSHCTSFAYPLPYLTLKRSDWACLAGIEVADTGDDPMVSLLALTICDGAGEHHRYGIKRTFKYIIFKAIRVCWTGLASVYPPSLILLKIARQALARRNIARILG